MGLCKIWKSGEDSFIITIPKKEVKFNNWDQGDLLEIPWNQVEKVGKVDKKGNYTKDERNKKLPNLRELKEKENGN